MSRPAGDPSPPRFALAVIGFARPPSRPPRPIVGVPAHTVPLR